MINAFRFVPNLESREWVVVVFGIRCIDTTYSGIEQPNA